MKKGKVLSVFIAIAIAFCYMPTSSTVNAIANTTALVPRSTIIDMPSEGFWSTSALRFAVNNGLLSGFLENGNTYIKPNDSLTRAQMVTIVNQAFGASELASLSGVSDVSTNAWYYNDVQKAVKMKSIALESKIRPNDNITRQEVFTILGKALKMETGSTTDLAKFEDASEISDWATPAMGAMVKAGYINGNNNKLAPNANITRAEFAVIMNNLIKEYITNPGTVNEVPSGNLMVTVGGVTFEDVTINGDLIIGDGVGDGTLTLNNVIVKGNIIARGGGLSSIIISSGSVKGKIVISKVDGKIRVFAKNDAKINVIEIDDGIGEIIIEGKIGNLEVFSAGTPVIIRNANIENIDVKTIDAGNIVVEKDSKVVNMVVGASAMRTILQVDGTVTNFKTYAQNTVLFGTGTVNNVKLETITNATNTTNSKTVLINTGSSDTPSPHGTSSGSTNSGVPVIVSTINILGEPKVGTELIASPVQTDATLTYQWKICNTADGVYADIPGATSKTYTPVASDSTKFIKVVATGTASYSGSMTSKPTDAVLVIFIEPDATPDTLINIKEIPGVIAPVTGNTPVTTTIDTVQYKAAVAWTPSDPKFIASKVYKATITLTPKNGFTLEGVAQDYFTIIGSTATNNANVGVVNAIFPVTDSIPDAVINISEIPGVVSPVTGEFQMSANIDTFQYTGELTWSPSDSIFRANTIYTATITLIPKTNFTLDGISQDYFTVAKAVTTNNANVGVINAIFPATDATPDAVINLSAIPRMGYPVTGKTPAKPNIDTVQYTGTLSWEPSDSRFMASTVYTATITLIPKTGFTLDGVATNFFKVSGAVATNNANSGVVLAVFPETLIVVVDEAAISGIASVGETLTAVSTPGAKNLTYKWQSSDKVAVQYADISGETSKTLLLKEELKGKFIRVIIYGDNSSKATSSPTTKVQP